MLALCRILDRYVMEAPRRWVCFEEPDEAYLAAAALRRYRDGSVDAILIPTAHGPAIDIARGLRSHLKLASSAFEIVALTRAAVAFHKPLLAAGIFTGVCGAGTGSVANLHF